jgi:hypothetical protein
MGFTLIRSLWLLSIANISFVIASASHLSSASISTRAEQHLWTYNFGSADFSSPEWQNILVPKGDEKCVIVVQATDEAVEEVRVGCMALHR